MTVHKLTAGDGYTYLTRQVAANDATDRGFDTLGAYYEAKGEAPGVWLGSGLVTLTGFRPKEGVREAQMLALFGQGRHPNAIEIEDAARQAGTTPAEVERAGRLGSPYQVYEQAGLFQRRSAGGYRDYNTARGQQAETPVPAEERARIRTELASQMFVETFGRLPADARELSGHLARISRQATTAVAGYDLSFSPVKSVSTLWAIAPREVAQVIEQAHDDAVRDVITWLERTAVFTRRGRNGVAQVDVHGLIAAAFTHRDSRAGDPDLHTHVAISNKVQAVDGTWLALDGRAIFKNGVAASERYNTRLEVLLVERLGMRFAERAGDDPGKRPVREIVGVDGPLPRVWSSRRAAIDARRAQLSATFQADHGRPPTAQEAIALAGRANLETRQAKHEPRTYAEQRAAWRMEAIAVLGGDTAFRTYVRAALTRTGRRYPRVDSAWVARTADLVLEDVQGERATWQANHVRAEAERQVRAAGLRVTDIDRAVDTIVTATLAPERSVPLGPVDPESVLAPQVTRRRDGSSIYTVAGAQLYTSTRILEAEKGIVDAAGRCDGRRVSTEAVEQILHSASGLNPGQQQMVHKLATSGARVQLALAPAGTGKTTAMRALAQAWITRQPAEDPGGDVVGLAPSAAAAAVLREEIGADTDTLAKLIHALDTGVDVPAWVTAIGPQTLVVIDEAGMAGTLDLARVIDHVVDRGGSVRLVGDDQQLAAIGAGGVLRDIATTHGAVTLSQVMRFTHPETGAPNHAEGAASLALRDGDPAAIAYYTDNGRVHVGDLTTVTDDAFTAWSAERAAGRDAIMLAPTRDLVTELNARARRARLDTATTPPGPEVRLVDGSHASAGDTIVTRTNNRRLAVTATDWVKNGDRWRVDAVRDDGALRVTHLRTRRHITLPADYASRHVTLGYASTIHGAQGITADASYTVATGDESRQLLYVALTRGRHSNHLFLTTAGDGDPHAVITRDALLPPTAVDILTRILTRDSTPASATSAQRDATDPATLLGPAADRYRDALGIAAADHLGPARMTAIDTAAQTALPGLRHCDAYPALRAHLALLAVDGHDPATLLNDALTNGPGLADARDPAAVLDWRLNPPRRRSPGAGHLPWLPSIPAALRDSPVWGSYLTRRADTVSTTATAVAARARVWTPTTAPPWAASFLDRDSDLVADLSVWRAAHTVDDGDQRATGPRLAAVAEARIQRSLDERITRLLGDPAYGTGRWAALASSIDQRISADPYWPTLADRLNDAHRAGIDITTLARAAAGERPLPDEQPAVALWWRLTHHLTPAAVEQSGAATLRPDWTPTLATIVGAPAADRMQSDPAWPSLVAAVTDAGHDGWTPEQLLSTSYDLLLDGQPDDQPLRSDELTTALTWRIGILTNPPPEIATQASPEHSPPRDTTPDIRPSRVHRDAVTDRYSDLAEDGPEADSNRDEPSRGRERIAELNRLAAEFFADRYPESWAPAYLIERLGTDLADEDRSIIGYAPDGWTALTAHLRRHGATDDEIVAAGLGTRSTSGRVIDRFRDRVVFAIQAIGPTGQPEIHGWIGRRNPTTTDGGHAGPKYLNTPRTLLFEKGRELFGLAENTTTLAAGATPVLVEGPLDALAVTLTGDGQYIGVAPLGTAFTDTQADALRTYIGTDRPRVIVATDADPAGRQAAHRAFWQLAARGDNPRHLDLDNGTDPAQLLQTHGASALEAKLEAAGPLADTLIADCITRWTDRLGTVEGRVHATRAATQIVAALPTATWPAYLGDIAAATDVMPETAIRELFEAHGSVYARLAAGGRLAERCPTSTSRTIASGPAVVLKSPYRSPEPRLAPDRIRRELWRRSSGRPRLSAETPHRDAGQTCGDGLSHPTEPELEARGGARPRSQPRPVR